MSRSPYLHDHSERLTDDTDAFGHRDYAEALTHALTEAEPPFTVGLFGAWGIGKSTILSEVKHRVKAAGNTYIYFDAWRYEGEAFRREFLKDVAAKLKDAGALKRSFDPDEELRDLYTTRATPDDHMTISKTHAMRATIAAVVILGVLYLGGLLSVGALTAKEQNTDPAILVFLGLLPLLIFLINRTTDIIQVKQNIITEQKLEEPERFSERFAALLRAVKAERVVIAIDNLDRLTADDAVALLSTVKTYLEPAIEEDERERSGEVLFLIAADDAALREHLMTRAPRVLGGSGANNDRRKAERYADEYLRKFFNTSLPLRPVLDDDIREFMRQHLAGLATRWERPEDLDDLVRLCAAGLRHNPRRVKQFVNNLELHLRLIRARETASASHVSKIDPPISQQLPVVTKLALIEEEWPEQFEAIRKRPGRLRTWNESAWRKVEPDDWAGGDWEEFAAFLRAGRHIATPNLRPFLRLKRSAVEAALPRYDEFHEAVTTSENEDALSLLFEDASAETIDGYAARLADIAEQELKAGNLDGAVAVVETAVSVDEFLQRTTACAEVLRLAVREPDLREALPQVSPKPLVAATRVLDVGARSAVYEVLVAEFLANAGAPASRESDLGAALATVVDDFTPEVAQQLRAGLDEDGLSPKFGYYLPLVEARPGVLPAGAAMKAFEAVTKSQSGQQKPQLRGAGPAWKVVKVAVTSGVLGEQEDQLIDHIIQALAQAAGANEAEPLIDDMVEVVDGMEQATPDAWQRLGSHLAQHFRVLPQDKWEALADVTIAILDRVPDQQRAQLASQVAQQLFGHPPFGIKYAQEHGSELPEELRGQIAAQLEQQVVGGQDGAGDALLAVDPDGGPGRLSLAAVTAAKQANHGVLAHLLDHHGAQLRSRRSEMTSPILARLEQPNQPQAAAADLEALSRLLPALSDDQRGRLAVVVTGHIHSPPPQAVLTEAYDTFLQRLATEVTFADQFKAILQQLLVQLNQPTVAGVKPGATFVAEHFGRLDEAGRTQFVAKLREWLGHDRQEAIYLASLARGLPRLPATEAEALIRALNDAEVQEDRAAHDTRVSLVTAIQAVADASGGKRAGAQRDAVLNRLPDGSEDDRAVYGKVVGS